MAEGFGAFGKIPSMGDFLRVNVTTGFLTTWDGWLQNGLVALRETLAAGWDDCYLSAPIWRFSLPAGQAGPSGVCGVLMASVDRVGRQYPLTLVAPMAPDALAVSHFANEAVFRKLEDIALAALEDDFAPDTLAAELATLSLNMSQSGSFDGTRYIGALTPAISFAGTVIAQNYASCGIWSTAVDEDHRLMLCNELPGLQELTGMFDLNATFWQGRAHIQNA